MTPDTIEINDRTDVDFIINDQRFNVSIRQNQLRIAVDGQIVIRTDAANVVMVDVESYGKRAR